jgi:enamine deaminase RidA (YjgF/YER057c/UK114 family)
MRELLVAGCFFVTAAVVSGFVIPSVFRSCDSKCKRHTPLSERKLISSGSTFEDAIGYSRAVVDGEWIFVSGTTGFDYQRQSISEDVVEQTRQCFINIETALKQAGSSLKDVVRVHYILPNGPDFQKCWPVLKEYFGDVKPAATMFIAGLLDPRMKIEIEVTAKSRK